MIVVMSMPAVILGISWSLIYVFSFMQKLGDVKAHSLSVPIDRVNRRLTRFLY